MKAEIKLPETKNSSLGMRNILGLIFVLIGILLILILLRVNLPMPLEDFETYLEYGAAAASILGGMSLLFGSKETVSLSK